MPIMPIGFMRSRKAIIATIATSMTVEAAEYGKDNVGVKFGQGRNKKITREEVRESEEHAPEDIGRADFNFSDQDCGAGEDCGALKKMIARKADLCAGSPSCSKSLLMRSGMLNAINMPIAQRPSKIAGVRLGEAFISPPCTPSESITADPSAPIIPTI